MPSSEKIHITQIHKLFKTGCMAHRMRHSTVMRQRISKVQQFTPTSQFVGQNSTAYCEIFKAPRCFWEIFLNFLLPPLANFEIPSLSKILPSSAVLTVLTGFGR